jgi:cytochrome c-type biogenesis protein
MGFSMDVGVPVVTVFLQGLLSFFSPCVLPLVPLYLGYLSGGAEQGELYGKRGRLFVNTICFVIGISSAFFMMGLGVYSVCTSLGFLENQSFWVQSTVSG